MGTLQVRQSLSDLACSMVFDEEDRRGEPLPEEREVPCDKTETKEAKVKARRKKRSLKAAGLATDESAPGEAQGDRAQAAADQKRKLKKRKRSAGSTSKSK